jgi:hypothetical protein
MQSSPTKRLMVLGFFALLFLLSTLRGWNAHKVASTPVECTEGPCDAGFDYGSAGLSAGALSFLATFLTGVVVFAIGWAIYKAVNKPKPPAA